MDFSVHPNAMVSFDFSSLSNVHKSVQRNSRTSKRKIRMDINKNTLQSFFESETDFTTTSQPLDPSTSPVFHGFGTQSPLINDQTTQLQDLPTRDFSAAAPARSASTNPGH